MRIAINKVIFFTVIFLVSSCSSQIDPRQVKLSDYWWSCNSQRVDACNAGIEYLNLYPELGYGPVKYKGKFYYELSVANYEKKEYLKAIENANKSISFGGDLSSAQSVISLATGYIEAKNEKPTLSNVQATQINTKDPPPLNPLIEAKDKCLALGFKDKTEGLGKCVLQLTK